MTLVARASFRRKKTLLCFHVLPGYKDGIYLNYVSQLISGSLFHFSEIDTKIKEKSIELGITDLCIGDELSITDMNGTRVYELKKDNSWYNILTTDGKIHNAELEEALKEV